ncbi:hypothetical protein I8D64_11670 [Brachybacterium sp. MASK1Z-5]|uniref:Lipoprotein n=1 Tax=Brachybacterium halotolerans TaxID=2795215 RepID=A0ABS1BBK6_9MICO|nr:hypothetical protein [Brachybacterium halotolerans]MBK0332057.1 hypothetical protein [Brachybacterium halotolerans]
MLSFGLALSGCDASSADASASDAATTAAEASATPDELTDLTVFMYEKEPLSVFTRDQLVCKPYGKTTEGIQAAATLPTVQILDGDGRALAKQEVAGDGPILGGECQIFEKFLDVPVRDSYQVVLEGETEDGDAYRYEGALDFDRGKYEDGFTQGYKFHL